jgi:hypothetical protein
MMDNKPDVVVCTECISGGGADLCETCKKGDLFIHISELHYFVEDPKLSRMCGRCGQYITDDRHIRGENNG